MIGVDWGTSSFRAYRMRDGQVVDKLSAVSGLMTIEARKFAETLRKAVLPWLNAGERQVLLSGMVGSRQGWVEAPYLPCPASVEALGASAVRAPFDGAEVLIVPGVSSEDAAGVPEVMRGEETQILGALSQIGAGGTVCLPGSHAKWAVVRDGRILRFATYMTGEAFAAFSAHTILGRMMKADAPADPAALRQGLRRSADPGGLLRHLFGVRTLGLFDRLNENAAASYLSGLLLGHEVRAALADAQDAGPVLLIGDPTLCGLYLDAIRFCGGDAHIAAGEPAALGLLAISRSVRWSEGSAS
jgi:2-dehydro-3-deoxygalactonokinase